MIWQEKSSASGLRWISACNRYVISAKRPSQGFEPYWTARCAKGEIASGYSDEGLERCKKYCEAKDKA